MASLSVLALVLHIGQAVSSSQPGLGEGGKSLNVSWGVFCGPWAMDVTRAICCEGNVIPRLDGHQCCRHDSFNPRWQVCCEDGLLLDGGPDLSCCGNKTFSPRSQSCCGGSVFPEAGVSCCGNQTYRPETDICCSGKTFPSPSSSRLCCGDRTYDTDAEICCANLMVYDRHGRMECCEDYHGGVSHPYDPQLHTCRHGVVELKELICAKGKKISRSSLNQLCCGNTTYNKDTHICCAYMSVHSQSQGTECCEDHNKNTSRPFHPHLHTCQDGVLTLKPCGGRNYDEQTQICCSGNLYGRSLGNDPQECCGSQSYPRQALGLVCCETILYERKAGHECNGSHFYNPITHSLCGSVVHRTEPGAQCCGHQLVNSTQICCEGQSHPASLGSGLARCCGESVYDGGDRGLACCGGRLHSAPGDGEGGGEVRQCCGDRLVDPALHRCCRSRAHSLAHERRPGFRCCGHHHYNVSRHHCCSQQLRDNPHPDVKLLNLDTAPPSTLCDSIAIVGMVTGVVLRGRHCMWTVESPAVLKANQCRDWSSTELTFHQVPLHLLTGTLRNARRLVNETLVFWLPDSTFNSQAARTDCALSANWLAPVDPSKPVSSLVRYAQRHCSHPHLWRSLNST